MKREISILTLTLFIFILVYTSCNGKNTPTSESQESQSTESGERIIQSISALYYNHIIEDNRPINPTELQKKIPQFESDRKGVLDALITDSNKLAKISSLLPTLQPSSQQNPIDARISVTINYNNGSKDVLYIGGKYTNRIYLNGIQQVTNNKLLFTVKNYIGFYPWIIGDNMFRMSEMKDNSFMKEPFTSSEYYKKYQEILANR